MTTVRGRELSIVTDEKVIEVRTGVLTYEIHPGRAYRGSTPL